MMKNFHDYKKEIDDNEYLINFLLNEGIDINYDKKKVYYNPNHQKNINTSININPTYSNINGFDVISIFKRKNNKQKTDGNPLIYALKSKRGWNIDDKDIINILKQFIRITEKIKSHYDTIIKVPTSSDLNENFLYRLNKIIKCDNIINDMFHKMESSEVLMVNDFSQVPKKDMIAIEQCFNKMVDENNGIFSYNYINPTYLRKYIKSSVKDSYIGNELLVSPMINEKNILILDDTISAGQTISEICKNIMETYTPKTITIITLFSPLK